MEKGDQIMFEMPTMSFYDLDIKPSEFYMENFNHLFNQMSLMILFKRCGLIPILQTNKRIKTIAMTEITGEKE